MAITVEALAQKLGAEVLHAGEMDREVTGCYCGDLLSWVMGRAQSGEVWCTIMSNQNVAAVAVLSDVACVLLTEGVRPDAELMKKAEMQDITLLGTEKSTFRAAGELAGLLG